MSFYYPEICEAIAIHDLLIDEFGGAKGMLMKARGLRH